MEAFFLLLISILSAWGYITLLHTLLRDHGTKNRLMVGTTSSPIGIFPYSRRWHWVFYGIVVALILMTIFPQKSMMILGL
jgi:hypothetical protein